MSWAICAAENVFRYSAHEHSQYFPNDASSAEHFATNSFFTNGSGSVFEQASPIASFAACTRAVAALPSLRSSGKSFFVTS